VKTGAPDARPGDVVSLRIAIKPYHIHALDLVDATQRLEAVSDHLHRLAQPLDIDDHIMLCREITTRQCVVNDCLVRIARNVALLGHSRDGRDDIGHRDRQGPL
jgi:hypothetical protein